MKFPEYKSLDLPQIGREVLARWKEDSTFAQSMALRKDAQPFVFYEGPPSANGMPGIHHVMARTIKDIFCRYKTLRGYLVKRKAGWDTHGLPVELGVEKALGITKEDIGKKISVEEYNAECRRQVMKYTKEWELLTEQMGYWVDMSDPYVTCDNRYIESVWHLIKMLYNKGLLYKGYTIQPYSPAAGTGLSTHELNQPGCYREVRDTTCTALFKAIGSPAWVRNPAMLPVYYAAWTTTPWTLPSNTALCVGADIDYAAVQSSNPYSGEAIIVIMARELAGNYFGGKDNRAETVGSCKGRELEGMRYEQLIPWVKPLPLDELVSTGKASSAQSSSDASCNADSASCYAFRIICGDFVSTADGTGIVHIAPTFGADDDRAAKQNGIAPMLLLDKNRKLVPMVDMTGKLYRLADLDERYAAASINVELYGEWAGRYVKNAYYDALPPDAATLDVDICVMLKRQGRALRVEKHLHTYPHCWRTDKPVLYYPLDSWFVRTTAVRERMIELNRTINWKPDSTGVGRFGKWLEDLKDWNFSRSRYWGTPLPIWRTADGLEEKCIGSMAELEEEMRKAGK